MIANQVLKLENFVYKELPKVLKVENENLARFNANIGRHGNEMRRLNNVVLAQFEKINKFEKTRAKSKIEIQKFRNDLKSLKNKVFTCLSLFKVTNLKIQFEYSKKNYFFFFSFQCSFSSFENFISHYIETCIATNEQKNFDIRKLTHAISNMNTQNANLSQLLSASNAQRTSLQTSLHNSQQSDAQARRDADCLRQRNTELSERLALLTQTNQTLQFALTQALQRNDELQNAACASSST